MVDVPADGMIRQDVSMTQDAKNIILGTVDFGPGARKEKEMDQPYYVITKITDSALTSSTQAISEAELKSRCEIVASILSGHSPGIRGWNEALEVLLHGERQEQRATIQESLKITDEELLHGEG